MWCVGMTFKNKLNSKNPFTYSAHVDTVTGTFRAVRVGGIAMAGVRQVPRGKRPTVLAVLRAASYCYANESGGSC